MPSGHQMSKSHRASKAAAKAATPAGSKAWCCKKCFDIFPNKAQADEHKTQEHVTLPMDEAYSLKLWQKQICMKCGFHCKNQAQAQMHHMETRHTQFKPWDGDESCAFACKKCLVVFKDKAQADAHHASTGPKHWPCPLNETYDEALHKVICMECGHEFANRVESIQHSDDREHYHFTRLADDDLGNAFACKRCLQIFPDKSQADAHKASKGAGHWAFPLHEEYDRALKKFICTECGCECKNGAHSARHTFQTGHTQFQCMESVHETLSDSRVEAMEWEVESEASAELDALTDDLEADAAEPVHRLSQPSESSQHLDTTESEVLEVQPSPASCSLSSSASPEAVPEFEVQATALHAWMHRALHSGREVLLADGKARSLGYESGNVRVRVKEVDRPQEQVYIGFNDGFDAWVRMDELLPPEESLHRAADSQESLGTAQLRKNTDLFTIQEDASHRVMLRLPASDRWKVKVGGSKKVLNDEQAHRRDRLVQLWAKGHSARFTDDYNQWLQSGDLNLAYQEHGIYFHTKLEIGKGGAARVYLGVMHSDGSEVAVKVHHWTSEADKHFDADRRNMQAVSDVPGIVPYVTSFLHEFQNHLGDVAYERVIVLKLMEGSLHDAMEQWESSGLVGKIPHLQVIRFVAESLTVVLARLNHGLYGKEQKMVHRDVKPENIMIDRVGAIRLGDFGISKVMDLCAASKTCSSTGPQLYASPEAKSLTKKEAKETSDLYSLGMVIVGMVLADPKGAKLDPSKNGAEQCEMLDGKLKQDFGAWPWHHVCSLQNLMRALLTELPDKRAFSDCIPRNMMTPHRTVLAHPFFWSSQKKTRFLYTLGSYRVDEREQVDAGTKLGDSFPNLRQEVEAVIRDKLTDGQALWFDIVEDMEQPKPRKTMDFLKELPLGLLKFIRNKYLHLNDSDMSPELRTKLTEHEFLHRFPDLVVRSWQALLDKDALRNIHENLQHAALLEFFRPSVDVDFSRST